MSAAALRLISEGGRAEASPPAASEGRGPPEQRGGAVNAAGMFAAAGEKSNGH